MATFTATTTGGDGRIGYCKYGENEWHTDDSDGACMGVYGSPYAQSNSRVGVIAFKDASETLKNTKISKIVLKITTTTAGRNATDKKLYFRTANYDYLNTDIYGSEQVGELMGSLENVARDKTTTFTLNQTTNSALFANMVRYFESGKSTLVLFDTDYSQSGGASYSYNYARVLTCVITVTYEEAQDGGAIYYFGNDGLPIACGAYYANASGEWIRCAAYYADESGDWIET